MGIEWVPLRRAGSTCALSRWPSSGREAKVRDLAGLPEGCSASNKAVAQLPSGLIHASGCQSSQWVPVVPSRARDAPRLLQRSAGRRAAVWAVGQCPGRARVACVL